MSDKTKISWTGATWNFVTGCSHVSPGCQNCYAERLAHRFGGYGVSEKTARPWTAQNATHNVRVNADSDKLKLPLSWKKPRKIFVNSMSDLFHEQVSDDVIRTAFVVMGLAPQHTFQILTKRPARMKAFIDSLVAEQDFFLDHWTGENEHANYFPNVWLGVSVEDQRRADERIPLLLQTPAAIRFLSCEPLLGEIDLTAYLMCEWFASEPFESCGVIMASARLRPRVDWVIVGGESGPNFRAMNLDWARSIRDQCAAANVPFWFKQSSGYRSETNTMLDGVEHHAFPEEQ